MVIPERFLHRQESFDDRCLVGSGVPVGAGTSFLSDRVMSPRFLKLFPGHLLVQAGIVFKYLFQPSSTWCAYNQGVCWMAKDVISFGSDWAGFGPGDCESYFGLYFARSLSSDRGINCASTDIVSK
jgi:hypothetical protein